MTPETDTTIAVKYSAKAPDKKLKNKIALQKELGWPSEPKRPMVCLPAGMSDQLGGDMLKEILPGLLSLPIEILILGKGENSYGALFTELAEKHRHRVHIVAPKSEEVSKMYAAADMAIFLTDPTSLPELATAMQYGAVPITPECRPLENYDPVQESGNAFTYEPGNGWLAFASLVRAVETYKLPFDWRTILKQCMGSVK